MPETERLIIREARAEDADEILSFMNSEFCLRYNCYEPFSKEKLLGNIAKRPDRVLVEKKSGRIIGTIGVEEDSMRYNPRTAGLNYMLREDCARRGYMREALRAVIAELFDGGTELVSARVFSENEASLRLLESLGFCREGMLRRAVVRHDGKCFDDCLYSVTKEELL